MSNQIKQILLISVGGSSKPVIHSLNSQQPDYVIYFTSRTSRCVVRQEIEPALKFTPADHEIIVTPDEQNLVESVSTLMNKLPKLLEDWGLDFDSVTGDYTGGTKTMSSALVLALSGQKCLYSYVGGTTRDKEGLGVVIDGREQLLHLENPWDVLAVEALHDIRLLFNRCRFRVAQELAERAASRVEIHRSFFQALQHIAEGFYCWDTFQYRPAFGSLRQGSGLLRPFVDGHPSAELKLFYSQVADCLKQLKKTQQDAALFKSNPSRKDQELSQGADGRTIIIDLMANAVRRADIEFKYDDAIARLYSAIEKIAKARLKVGYVLDNSDLDLDKLPEELHKKLMAESIAPSEGKIQFPLHRSFSLLADLHDPIGQTYLNQKEALRKVLSVRNASLLAHGFDPVSKETYENLLSIALDFAQLSKEDLPQFPILNWEGNLL